ncbi:AzlD domain-containing protein [Pseudomonas psychrotolerans]|uniref:Branched-subunit amino acid transport protein n=1 Tax=Pseudomonas oryzihabitans TaxID=47885 RepID=A0AAJ2BP80_9PSED|nr:AzlD domain-containing protein [Pseudomonas psychrotolerans]MDR6234069.1 branched-subunit amino acid transport protein [Pseudomonas psychrotolerans]MDR6356830.1 branched-subunit amino acid transport protein [Pseudomonas psychrotolerans]MDR6677834.1 branched-subunit amino acid transport protein [Pseudomonas psychrotolerans]QDD90208.1 branched-chain amino acid ABC transporter [Pseudomonas psychrotolerans]
MIIATLLGMAALVFFNRYVFLEPRLPLRLGRNLRTFLEFAVPGMLTAICGPILISGDASLTATLLNPYLLAGLAAVGLMLWTRRVLTTVVLSMGVFYLLRWLL